MGSSDWRFPGVVREVEHGRPASFDDHGCRCGDCVAAWRARGPELERAVIAVEEG